jgi:hypothetical protein
MFASAENERMGKPVASPSGTTTAPTISANATPFVEDFMKVARFFAGRLT